MPRDVGISNRMTPEDEARDRREHPPEPTEPAPAADASGRPAGQVAREGERQTSHKAGSRSVAQKEAGSRYPDRATPASKKVAGAFGKEPVENRDDR